MPVREAVESLRKDGMLPDPAVAAAIANGGTLADALRRAPGTFAEADVALVEAGENTGRLDEVLDRLAGTHDAERRSWKQLRDQCRYPVLLFHVAAFCIPLGVVTLLSGRLRIGFCMSISIGAIAAFWIAWIAVMLSMRDPRIRARVQRRLASIPGFGAWHRHHRAAVVASVLEASYESGIKLDEALRVAAATAGAGDAEAAATLVEKGAPLGEALRAHPLLPAAITGRLATAERAGELGSELRRAAEEEFAEAERSLAHLAGVLSKGAYLLILAGAVVYILYVLGKVYGAYQAF